MVNFYLSCESCKIKNQFFREFALKIENQSQIGFYSFQDLKKVQRASYDMQKSTDTIEINFQKNSQTFIPQNLTEPSLKGLSLEEFRSNLLSDRFQRILTVNLYYSGIWLLFGLSVLQQLANQRRNVLLRRKRELNNTETLHFVEDFFANLNLQLETYPSYCSN